MMYLLSLQSIKEMTTTGKKDTGDRVEMVVKVHCGTVLGDEFVAKKKALESIY